MLLKDLEKRLSEQLYAAVHHSGHFVLACKTKEHPFVPVGNSPFVAAHVAILLSGQLMKTHAELVNRILNAIETLDDSRGNRLYRFWYGDAMQTEYQVLPYDTDDTALTGIALKLAGRKSVNPTILSANIGTKGELATWFQWTNWVFYSRPRLWWLLPRITPFSPIFQNNSRSIPMARYNDSELSVRLNVCSYLHLFGFMRPPFSSDEIDFSPQALKAELDRSLHYHHLPILYFGIATYFSLSPDSGPRKADALEQGIRSFMNRNRDTGELTSSDQVCLYLSLALTKRFNAMDLQTAKSALSEWYESLAPIELCVGNKRYPDHHTYISLELAMAMMLRLIAEMQALER